MSRRDWQRLEDIQAALDAINDHLARGDLSDGLVYDAVRVRLIEIGEAVKGLSADLLATEPDLPWAQIAGMRDDSPTATSTPPTPSCKAPSTTTCPSSPPRSNGSEDRSRTDQPSTPMPTIVRPTVPMSGRSNRPVDTEVFSPGWALKVK